MSAIQVEFPQDLEEFIESKVRHGHFASASEYIVALVESARNGRSAIETALIEGLDSGPAEEWTKQEWESMRQRVIQRHEGQ